MPFLIIAGLIGLVVVFYVSRRYGQFMSQVNTEINTLIAQQPDALPRIIHFSELDDLPPPVRFYLQRSLIDGKPYAQFVRLKQRGTLRLKPDQPWKPFTAEQYFSTVTPAFIWRARAMILPFLPVMIRDKYRQQDSEMLIQAFGALTIDRVRHPKLVHGALLRYVAELMWMPSALIPDERLRWEAVSDNSARAVFCDDGVSAAVMFYFNDDGDIDHIEAERYMNVNDAEPTKWYGFCRQYATLNGVRIPTHVEVGWEPDSGYYTWWRGTITALDRNVLARY